MGGVMARPIVPPIAMGATRRRRHTKQVSLVWHALYSRLPTTTLALALPPPLAFTLPLPLALALPLTFTLPPSLFHRAA
jgi:hypothetical protein